MTEKEMIKEFDKLTQQEKLNICKTLNGFITFNSIPKHYIIHVFKWLYSVSVEEVEHEK